MRVFTDWNCKLLPMMGDAVRLPRESIEAMEMICERSGIKRFCMMPEFDCRMESVQMFLVRRDKAMREVQEILPAQFKIQTAGCVILSKGVSQIPQLNRLRLPQTNYVPIQLPLEPEPDWLAVELNRMIYHMPFRLLFMSFDLYRLFYPTIC